MSKFYKTIIQVEVLSEDGPYEYENLEYLKHDITEGHFSGTVEVTSSVPLTTKQMTDALIAQGTDPEFFGLDKNGICYECVECGEIVDPEEGIYSHDPYEADVNHEDVDLGWRHQECHQQKCDDI